MQIQQAASNQRWCSDVFLIPCWSGEVLSVAFAIDCHDREAPAYVASPRSLTGADIRTLMDRTLWARFGEAKMLFRHKVLRLLLKEKRISQEWVQKLLSWRNSVVSDTFHSKIS